MSTFYRLSCLPIFHLRLRDETRGVGRRVRWDVSRVTDCREHVGKSLHDTVVYVRIHVSLSVTMWMGVVGNRERRTRHPETVVGLIY